MAQKANFIKMNRLQNLVTVYYKHQWHIVSGCLTLYSWHSESQELISFVYCLTGHLGRPPWEWQRVWSKLSLWGFSRLIHTSKLYKKKIDTPVATLPGDWYYRVCAGTGWPSVSIMWPGEIASLICNFCVNVATHTTVWADPSLRYTSMLLGYLASKQK